MQKMISIPEFVETFNRISSTSVDYTFDIAKMHQSNIEALEHAGQDILLIEEDGTQLDEGEVAGIYYSAHNNMFEIQHDKGDIEELNRICLGLVSGEIKIVDYNQRSLSNQ